MNAALQPFLTVALPIMITLIASMWANNSRLTDLRTDSNRNMADMRAEFSRQFDNINGRFGEMNGRFGEVLTRLDRIERKLDNHEERLVRVEEGTSLLHR